MLHIVVWKWHQEGFRIPYGPDQVNVMAAMLKRTMGDVPYRLVCVTDNPKGVNPGVDTFPLWEDFKDVRNASGGQLPSCYRRLRLFEPATQTAMGIAAGDRIMSLDLDTVLLGEPGELGADLSACLTNEHRWVGWKRRGTYHPWVFNGSLWLFTAGDLAHLWTDFDVATSPQVTLKRGFFGSDQSWLSMNLAREKYAHGLALPLIASYPQEIRRSKLVDKRTRMVFFHGTLKPWHPVVQREAPWVLKHWRLP